MKERSALINSCFFNFKPRCFLILGFLCISAFSKAQAPQLPNGTVLTMDYLNELEANLVDERLMPFDPENPDLNERLGIEVFIIRDKHGDSNINISDLDESIDILNGFFGKMGVEFNLNNITYVPEYEYAFITHTDSTMELETRYSIENKINLFLVDSIKLYGTHYFGYTFYPTEPERNFIFLRKEYILDNYLVTLMGTFFGLLFTHETLGGTEFVTGTNCGTTGDYICETPADPLLFGMVDSICHYQGTVLDPESNFYIPTVANIMSESLDFCKCIFTNEQYRRMKYYLFNLRDYLR